VATQNFVPQNGGGGRNMLLLSLNIIIQ